MSSSTARGSLSDEERAELAVMREAVELRRRLSAMRQPREIVDDPATLGKPLSPRSVVILMTDGIGDVVCATGLVRDLRASWPRARFVGIVKSPVEGSLFRGSTALDRFIYFNVASDSSVPGLLRLWRAVLAERPDVFLAVTDIDASKAPLLAAGALARHRIGEKAALFGHLYSRRRVRSVGTHKVLSNRALGRLAGVDGRSDPLVELTATEREEARTRLGDLLPSSRAPTIAVHPGSGHSDAFKRWPVERFAAALRPLVESGVNVVAVGSSADVELCNQLCAALPASVSLAGSSSLVGTAAALAECSVALGADSGVMHLASAVRTPTIVVFGPTDERRTAPWNATEVISLQMPCRSCFGILPGGCGEAACLTDIRPERVTSALQRALSRSLDKSTI